MPAIETAVFKDRSEIFLKHRLMLRASVENSGLSLLRPYMGLNKVWSEYGSSRLVRENLKNRLTLF